MRYKWMVVTYQNVSYMYLFSVKGGGGWSLLTSPYLMRRVSRFLNVFSPTLMQ